MIRLPSLLLLMLNTILLSGQLQHGGKPFDISEGIRAADVMYVLPLPDSLQIKDRLDENSLSGLKIMNYAIERGIGLKPGSNGKWINYKGYNVWRVHIISPGARSLGVILDPYRLKDGAKLFIYNPDQDEIKGSFTYQNNKPTGVLPIGHVAGEEVVLELQVPEGQDDYGELGIKSLSHAFLSEEETDINLCPGDHGCSQACEIDVNCEEGDAWQTLKRSVVRIRTSTQYCTGVMVNNTAYDGKPYVLTVEHCINSQAIASGANFYFKYESPECFGGDGSKEYEEVGGFLKTAGDSLDFSIVELFNSPPDSRNAYYAGWDLTPDPLPDFTTIHHPMGDVKKISLDFDNVSVPESKEDVISALWDYHYFSFWWVHEWDAGSTEPGSSGAPLFTPNKQVVGLLSGGEASCGVKTGTDPETGRDIFSKFGNVNDYYTRMDIAWDYNGDLGPNLKEWLDPINTGQTAIGGYNPVTNTVPPVKRSKSLALYPNPAEEFIILSAARGVSEYLNYTIYDLTGKIIQLGAFYSDAPERIDLHNLESGIYMVNVVGKTFTESIQFLID